MDSPTPRTYPQNHNLLPSSPHNIPSPNSSSSSNNGAVHHTQQLPPLSPTTPKSVTRSESSATLPTTFVQADSSSFKQVVQMLTGCSETAKQASAILTPTINNNNNVGHSNNHHHHHHHMIPPMKTMQQPQQSGYKLYQRRNNNLNINPLVPSFPKPYSYPYPYPSPPASGLLSPTREVALSPSILDFPSLVLSPVTPLIPDPFVRSGPAAPTGFALYPSPVGNKGSYLDPMAVAEEKAIKEKGFFLHPSPSTTPRGTEPPRLLPLFPTTSPRARAEAEGGAASSPSS